MPAKQTHRRSGRAGQSATVCCSLLCKILRRPFLTINSVFIFDRALAAGWLVSRRSGETGAGYTCFQVYRSNSCSPSPRFVLEIAAWFPRVLLEKAAKLLRNLQRFA